MFTPLDGTDGLNLDYCMRLLPHHADTGGFFVAVLEKTDKLPWQKTTEDMNKYCPAPNYEVNGMGPPANKKPKVVQDSRIENLNVIRLGDEARSTRIRSFSSKIMISTWRKCAIIIASTVAFPWNKCSIV